MADMQELIARLETAEAGGRELDVALAWHRWVEPKMWGSTNAKGDPVWKVERDGKRVPLPEYTTSLDAALALAERVLPEWAWEIRLDRGGASVQAAPAWWMEGLAAPDEGGVSCDGKTPALALCIAILKAKAQGEGR